MIGTTSVERPTNVDALVALIREAKPELGGVFPRGAGLWVPGATRDGTVVELGAFAGISAYNPADLTISVGAGTTLAELDAATRAHHQWCPLLPWGDDRGTVGATIATGSSGPFAASLGRPRDLVLGIEAVDGRARVIRAGGTVVKNVAGFDLTRLMTGAWGTLGVITALHLRLRARPAVDETFALCGSEMIDERVLDVARGPYAPLALHAVSTRARQVLALDADARWLVRLGGNARFVSAARGAFQSASERPPIALATDAWTTVRVEDAPAFDHAAWRWTPLSRRIKQMFDPRGVLNPGILGSES